ncbi:MAG: hypothetical protein WCP19_11775 [Chloroflexota bacterium]
MKRVSEIRTAKIPVRLKANFQEYDTDKLDMVKDAVLVMQRTLEFGNWDELRWLFHIYGDNRIRKFLREHGERFLSPVTFTYWRKMMKIRKWKPSPFSIKPGDLWKM